MPLITSLQDLELTLQLGSVTLPLHAMAGDSTPPTPAPAEAEPPNAPESPPRPSPLRSALKLRRMRKLPLSEILAQIDDGLVTIHLPLPRVAIDKGMLEIDLRAGHNLILDLVITDTEIVFDDCTCRIEPPIDLPLGIELRGLYIDEDGDVHADISSFPDINLTRWVDAVPRIPATIDGLVRDLKERAEARANTSASATPSNTSSSDTATPSPSGPAKPGGLDLTQLRVEARNIHTRGEDRIDLGELGSALLAEGTQLSVDFVRHSLSVRGKLVLTNAVIHGQGFTLKGITASTTFAFRRTGPPQDTDTSLKLTNLDGTAQALHLRLDNGTALELSPLEIADTQINFERDEGQIFFTAELTRVDTQLASGVVVAPVAGQSCPITLEPTRLHGKLELSRGRAAFDLNVDSLGVTVPPVATRLGPLDLTLAGVDARGSGKIRGSNTEGIRFDGQLSTTARVGGTTLDLGNAQARLNAPSQASFQIQELVTAGGGGLVALKGSGAVHLELGAGSVPLTDSARLVFLEGATGTLNVAALTYHHDQRFPHLQGSRDIDAQTEPVVVGDLVDPPAGTSRLDARLPLDPKGILQLSDTRVSLVSSLILPGLHPPAPSLEEGFGTV